MKSSALICAAVLMPQFALADQLSDVRGIWIRDDGNARVSIAPCGKQLCATNLWIRDTSRGEQPGDKLIMTLNPKSRQVLVGKAYDPKRKLTYSMTLTVTQDGLSTRGCVVGGLICKNTGWKPAK
ncbi:DUF2147 domain-containing protein [uncultured Mesorhizobium sp.]|uniref:DUF2147 domain-containing protein n=2 Tax=unclassified Mesorhizobium TaxID=325217 RepID=UPI00096A005A|nr:DUF2147 domain-containing protein [Mesorhizobium sp.]OJX75999.1 MAG: hypothetical protein BGO93_28755 [Mesorhizobium sp. 65-26]